MNMHVGGADAQRAEFKAGDKVRFTDRCPKYWWFGPHTAIKGGVIEGLEGFGYKWSVTADDGETCAVNEEHIEHVVASAFKVGDRVRLCRDDYCGDYKAGDLAELTDVTGEFVWFKDRDGDERMIEVDAVVAEAGSNGKFKAGDRVRIASGPNNGGFGEVGDIGVVQFTSLNDCSVKFETGSRCGEAWYVAFEHLEPVAQQPQITIREGGYYRTRDGRKVGPMRTYNDGWAARGDNDGRMWKADGSRFYGGNEHTDLIAEWHDEPAPAVSAPSPSEPKFKVGDRVRVVSIHEDRVERYLSKCIGKEFVVDSLEGTDGEKVAGCDIPYWFHANELRLVAEATSGNSPAMVARLDNGQPLPAPRPHVHASVADASKEATRLAKANPGREFAVYEMVHSVTEERTFDYEWQRAAKEGREYDAACLLQDAAGTSFHGAQAAVTHWLSVTL